MRLLTKTLSPRIKDHLTKIGTSEGRIFIDIYPLHLNNRKFSPCLFLQVKTLLD